MTATASEKYNLNSDVYRNPFTHGCTSFSIQVSNGGDVRDKKREATSKVVAFDTQICKFK